MNLCQIMPRFHENSQDNRLIFYPRFQYQSHIYRNNEEVRRNYMIQKARIFLLLGL